MPQEGRPLNERDDETLFVVAETTPDRLRCCRLEHTMIDAESVRVARHPRQRRVSGGSVTFANHDDDTTLMCA